MCDKKPVLVSSFLFSVGACVLAGLLGHLGAQRLVALLVDVSVLLLAGLLVHLGAKFFVQLPLFVVLMDNEHMFLVPVLLCLVSRLFTGVRSM